MDTIIKKFMSDITATSVGVTRQFTEMVTYYNDFQLSWYGIVTSRGEVNVILDKENDEIHSIVVRRFADHSSVPDEDFDHNTFDEYAWHNPDYDVENKDQWLQDFWKNNQYYSAYKRRYSTFYDVWEETFIQDIVDKAISITTGSPFDNTVLLAVDFDDEMLEKVKEAAAKMEVTLNEYIEMAIDNVMFGKK